MWSRKPDLSPDDEIREARSTVKPIHKRGVRKIGRLGGESCRHRDWKCQRCRGQHSRCQYNARQNTTHHRSHTREIIGRAKVPTARRLYKRSELRVETRETEQCTARALTECSGRAAGIRVRHKRLIVKRTKQHSSSQRSNIWPSRRLDYGWRTAPNRSAEKRRIWQIKTGKIRWTVYLNPAVTIGLEKQFDVVVQAHVEAQRNVRDINVSRITIIIAVSNTESEFSPAYSRPVVNSEESGWPTFGTTRAYRWRLISRILLRSQSLC